MPVALDNKKSQIDNGALPMQPQPKKRLKLQENERTLYI